MDVSQQQQKKDLEPTGQVKENSCENQPEKLKSVTGHGPAILRTELLGRLACIRKKLSSVENCLEKEIDQMMGSHEKVDQTLKSTGMTGEDSIKLMKKMMAIEMNAKKKVENWNSVIEEMQEKLENNFEILECNFNGFDENENQLTAPVEENSVSGPSTTDDKEEDAEDFEGQAKEISEEAEEKLPPSQSEVPDAPAQIRESVEDENHEEKEEEEQEAKMKVSLEEARDGSGEEGSGEKNFSDIAGQNCRKEIFSKELQDGSKKEAEEEVVGGVAGEVIVPEQKSCFQSVGLRKLSFCDSEPEMEAPRVRRQATVDKDGIIEPASETDSDTEDEEEEEVVVMTKKVIEREEVMTEGTEGGSEEVNPGIKFPKFSPGQKIRCTIVEVVSPEEFWVREEVRTQELYQTYGSLQTVYSLLDQETQPSWSVGSSCAVKTRDKGWVRALVLAVEGDKVRLLHGDIGRVVTHSSQDLQPLQVEFTEETFFCFRVKVPGMVPAGSSCGAKAPWSRVAREVLEEHGAQPVLVEIIRNDEDNFTWISNLALEEEKVDLLKTEIHQESVTDLLLMKGLALREEQIKDEGVKGEIFRWPPPAFPTTAKFQGVIHHVDWRGRVYVTAHPEASREKEKIDTALNVAHLITSPELETKWVEGEACIARYSLDYNWYRATVLDSSSSPQIKVQFVDYGTEVTVHQDFLRRDTSFQDFPALAFPVRLNVKPKCTKWEKKELDFIHETAVDKLGNFEVLQPSQECWLVSLELPGLADFGQFLVQNGFCREGLEVE